MAVLKISYVEHVSGTYYALLFNQTELAYRTDTRTFFPFASVSVDNNDIALSNSTSRPAFWSSTGVSAAVMTKGKYFTEIWQQVGGAPNQTGDFLKATNTFFWDGVQETNFTDTYHMDGESYLGTKYLSENVYFGIQTFNEYGDLETLTNRPSWRIYTSGGFTNVSGLMNVTGVGFYYGLVTLTGGVFRNNRSYDIRIESTVDGTHAIGSLKTFNIVDASGNVPGDPAHRFGYASGVIGNFPTPTVSSWACTTISTGTDYYNGSIARFTTGASKNQARIIVDTINNAGISTTIVVNKPFNALAITDTFLIYPIGGELGL